MILILMISDDGQSIVRRIYDKYHKLMIKTATEILGASNGEDAVHDVFLKIIEKFENNFEELGDKPGRYFVILARNHSLNLIKKKQVDTISLEKHTEKNDSVLIADESPEDMLLQQSSFEQLVSLVRQLNPDTRRIMVYKYILGYTNKEISDITGLSQTAVSTRVSKAKEKLYELYMEAETN